MGVAHMDYCWRKAAEYTQRAEETTDQEVRTFFYRLRDAWISAGNRNEMLDALDVHVPPVSPLIRAFAGKVDAGFSERNATNIESRSSAKAPNMVES